MNLPKDDGPALDAASRSDEGVTEGVTVANPDVAAVPCPGKGAAPSVTHLVAAAEERYQWASAAGVGSTS